MCTAPKPLVNPTHEQGGDYKKLSAYGLTRMSSPASLSSFRDLLVSPFGAVRIVVTEVITDVAYRQATAIAMVIQSNKGAFTYQRAKDSLQKVHE